MAKILNDAPYMNLPLGIERGNPAPVIQLLFGITKLN